MKLFRYFYSNYAWSVYIFIIVYIKLDQLPIYNRLINSVLSAISLFLLLSLNTSHQKWMARNVKN